MAIDNENQLRRTKLSLTKLALLEQRLQGKQAQAVPKGRIPRRGEHDITPLSSAQRRLWFLDQLQPDNSVYNIPVALHLQGILNVAALEHSLNQIITRHEILRTTFTTVEEQPVQVIAKELVLHIAISDLTTWPTQERTQEVDRLISAESLQPFSLERGPLLRARLLQIAENEQILLLTVHHIIADAWSLGVVYTRELITNYLAFIKGLPSPLPALPIQYADFSAWQHAWLQESVQAQEQLAYWKKHLADAQTVLELPADYQRSLLQSFQGASQDLTLAPELTAGLRALSQEAGVTLFMTLVAALNVLFSRYTGQTDILLGTPIANRTRPELEDLIGFFANTLVLRTDLTGNPGFREVLHRVEQDTTVAYAHQELPFEKLVEELHPERDLSRSPLVQVMFSHNNTPMQEVTLPGLTISILPSQVKTAKFDLTLMMEDTGNRLQGYFEYNTDLFEAATIARLATHFQRVLEAVVANPQVRLADIPLLSEVETHLILNTWNQTHVATTKSEYVHVLIEQQVERTPDGLALLFADRRRSYRELNQEANQLAWRLRELGVGPEVLVGVSMHRSIELMVALLAVLKAGGVYVPLDPEYPAERLHTLIEDAGLTILLTQSTLRTRFAQETVQCIELDEGWNAGLDGGETNLLNEGSVEQGMYMIYTSGSTGQPKGVINTHRAVANRLTWGQRTYPLTSADRVLQKTPFSFDVSVSEFFWPLLAGATLVLAQPGGHQDPAYLVETIEEYQITSVHFVPSMFSLFLQQSELATRCRSLRQVFTSGEALSVELAERFFVRFPDPAVRLHNLYGPTEAAVEVTFWECERGLSHQPSTGGVPIGRPIANVQTYVLDARMQPVPIGVPGELYLGGIALARGYHRRPALTQEKFVAHPFIAGQRLYKTGDRVRYRSDGAIEFLGRLDQQVKLRGFRIELGEVEALLEQVESVRQAVVLLRDDPSGSPQLVAYVVLKQAGMEPTQLRQALRQRVPDYLVPAIIVVLEELPLLSSGKVDRKRLPAPQQDRSQVVSRYLPARTALEEQLVAIWAEVLGRQEIGVQDNFFELGGHSLKAIQLLTRVREKLQKNLSLGHFFQAQTIAEMALLLERNDEPVCLLPVRKVRSTHPPLFLFHPAGGEIFAYRLLVEQLKQDIPVYGLQSRALTGAMSEHTSIEEMADEYTAAIRQQQPTGPYRLLGWSMGGVLAVAVASKLERSGQEVQFIGLLDSYLTVDQAGSIAVADPLIDLGLAFGGKLMQAFANLSREEQERLRAGLLALSERERFQQVLRWGKERELFPDNLSVETFLVQAALVSTHRALLKGYQAPVVNAPLVVWWASEHTQARTDWGKYTRGGLQERVREGNHFTIMQPPSSEIVAQELGTYLDRMKLEVQVTIA